MLCSSDRKTLRSRLVDTDHGTEKRRKKKDKRKPPVDSDTIAAVITPAGQGGIGAIRIAGPHAADILRRIFRPTHSSEPKPFLMRHGQIVSGGDRAIDEALAVFMPAGKSYTGLDQVEFFCHGGYQVVRIVLELVLKSGARVAEPGEFTKLAFLNGRIDLARAEAVGEMIAASTEAAYQAGREHLIGEYSEYVGSLREQLVAILAEVEASIDFADDDVAPVNSAHLTKTLDAITRQIAKLAGTYEGGRIIREGYRVAIWGRPNAGKSSLFNALLRQERALVDHEPGTTRDYLSEWIDLDGYAVNLIDTAGVRGDSNKVEKAGQDRSRELVAKADLVLWLADLSAPGWQVSLESDAKNSVERSMLFIGNKIDLVTKRDSAHSGLTCCVSCLTGDGFDTLRDLIVEHINEGTRDLTSGQIVTSARHRGCLDSATESLQQTLSAVEAGESPEILAFELRRAVGALAEITGQVYTEEILEEIFSRFCIGK